MDATRRSCWLSQGVAYIKTDRKPNGAQSVKVQVHQVFQLFAKTRVVTQLESLHPMRFQSVCPPDPTYRSSAHPDYPRHGTGAPVGLSRRLFLGSEAHDFIHRWREDARGPPGPRPILQTVHLGYREALSPAAYGLPAQPQFAGDLLVLLAGRGPQDDTRTFHQTRG